MFSFVNDVSTKDGGTHEVGFKTAMTRVFNDYARRINELKTKDKNLDGNDIREGLTAVIYHLFQKNYYNLKDKRNLNWVLLKLEVLLIQLLPTNCHSYLEEKGQLSKSLVKKAIKAQQAREAARKAREDARSGKKNKRKKICYLVN
ncbi:hypothetical protein ACVQ92_00195 [Staphylococcus aureus]